MSEIPSRPPVLLWRRPEVSAAAAASGGQQVANVAGVVFTKKARKSKNNDGTRAVNGWTILQTLGQGGFGKVKLVHNRQTDEFRAFKVMSKRMLKRKRLYSRGDDGRVHMVTALDKVMDEVDIMKQINHPHVISLLEVINDPNKDNLYLSMQLAENTHIMHWDGRKQIYVSDVFVIEDNGGIYEEAALRIFRDTLEGLQCIHEHNVAHRDIKPENLLMCKDGNTMICDFGVAVRLDLEGDGRITSTSGTYHFTPPEACTGDSFNAFESDLWALGVTLFIMLFGSVPWHSVNKQELFNLIAEQELVVPEEKAQHLSAEAIDLVRKMLAKRPEDRLTIAQLWKHPWVTSRTREQLAGVTRTHLSKAQLKRNQESQLIDNGLLEDSDSSDTSSAEESDDSDMDSDDSDMGSDSDDKDSDADDSDNDNGTATANGNGHAASNGQSGGGGAADEDPHTPSVGKFARFLSRVRKPDKAGG
eukprot:TRINITY_DN66674_c5_g9_i1.p2 TRINITY_DN66674_c5_g9~~TRINITY_DN66674_c5_g9_i1.p2  ORF type:complete len:474 (+),score=249.04 TRINITY_DN66674_c5_g9_i1:228-1649(+)